MRHGPRTEVHRAEGYEIHVVGTPPTGLRDLYPALLRTSWPVVLSVIVGGYLFLNLLFAGLYLVTGGIAHAAPDSLADAFFFSVQTMGTIGYGTMYPETRLANALVVVESITGLLVTALATGLVFSRFSITRARVRFSAKATISPMDGVPTLVVRLGNSRRGVIVDARFRMTLVRTVMTEEGVPMYRSHDLPLVREHAQSLSRSWSIMHKIDRTSPLHGATPESLAAADAELVVSVTGIDDVSLQPVHAQHTWIHPSILFGVRLADVLTEHPDGRLVLDLNRFDDVTPVATGPSKPADG